jgi:hypothetical protein
MLVTFRHVLRRTYFFSAVVKDSSVLSMGAPRIPCLVAPGCRPLRVLETCHRHSVFITGPTQCAFAHNAGKVRPGQREPRLPTSDESLENAVPEEDWGFFVLGLWRFVLVLSSCTFGRS